MAIARNLLVIAALMTLMLALAGLMLMYEPTLQECLDRGGKLHRSHVPRSYMFYCE